MKKKVVFLYSSVEWFDDDHIKIGKYQYQILSLSLKRSDFRSAVVDPGDLMELQATIAVSWRLNSLACRDSVLEEATIRLFWEDPIWGPKRWLLEGSEEFISALRQEGVAPISDPEEIKEQPTENK